MRISAELIQELIKDPESETLDVKREQYHMSKDDKRKQSEILKDILAFANTVRDTNAYILIGVKEQTPPPHEIVGMSTPVDAKPVVDNQLQQFVNSKTNKRIRFLYQEVNVKQFVVGVISIEPQEGPFFATRNYGIVLEDKVLSRDGSSTVTLTLSAAEEIIREQERVKWASTNANHDCVFVDSALRSDAVHFNEFAATTTDAVFDRCILLSRRGEIDAANVEIDAVIADTRLAEKLTNEQRARALRIGAWRDDEFVPVAPIRDAPGTSAASWPTWGIVASSKITCQLLSNKCNSQIK